MGIICVLYGPGKPRRGHKLLTSLSLNLTKPVTVSGRRMGGAHGGRFSRHPEGLFTAATEIINSLDFLALTRVVLTVLF